MGIREPPARVHLGYKPTAFSGINPNRVERTVRKKPEIDLKSSKICRWLAKNSTFTSKLSSRQVVKKT